MEGLLRALIFAGIGVAMYFVFNGDPSAEISRQPIFKTFHEVAGKGTPETSCTLWTPEFRATFASRGAGITSYRLLTAKYQHDDEGLDLATTPDLELDRSLRFHFRNPAVAAPGKQEWNANFDLVNWTLVRSEAKLCEFHYQDEKVELAKTLRTTEQPYEIEVTASIKNLADKTLPHALSVSTAAWRYQHEVEGKFGRISPYITSVECIPVTGDEERKLPDEFEPDDFADDQLFRHSALHRGDWMQPQGEPAFTAVTNAYFAQALVPLKSAKAPVCQLQIDERIDPRSNANSGSIYRARLAYPERDLKPGESTEYSVLSFIGPKERLVLASAGKGEHQLDKLIDLGFFTAIAKVLVNFLLTVYGLFPNWGVAIIVLTVTARFLLFPLSLPSIKNMIRMRELKPDMDALNEKFKDDPQQKGLAQMELWKKEGVNPFKGCLPQLASMPVWFALYRTLQSAVELYNIPFLWFPDLSEPDPYFVLPLIIGVVFFLQQKLMPMQGGDPMQQKMMMYFMPGMFTVFMLFLPAGLGVYMFTNSLLAITQQQVVEWHTKRSTGLNRDGSTGSKKAES
ncbi:MAG: membrane protein insertase YidC [Polyangiaceae bacterium]|nr:membrane protein insertase YidC [Polyangiaceae bacterium]